MCYTTSLKEAMSDNEIFDANFQGRSSSVIRRKAKKDKEIPILNNERVIPDAEIMPKKMLNKRL